MICNRDRVWPGLLLLGCCAVLAIVAQPARAAVTEAWVQRYSDVVSNANDQAFKVVRDAAGDIIVTGTTDAGTTGKDMLTIKYSGADGSFLWQKRYNGPANSDDETLALAVDGSGNVVVTGVSNNGAPNYGYDFYTAKYAAANGALFWENHATNPVVALAVDSSGNVVVTGSSHNDWPNYDSDYYTAKYAAANGALLWEKRYNGPANSIDGANAEAVDGIGNVVVTGYSVGPNGGGSFFNTLYRNGGGCRRGAATGSAAFNQRLGAIYSLCVAGRD